MLDRFERPIKIICLGMALLLAWQLGSLLWRGDPLARLKIPALPALPGATNETAKTDSKGTNAAAGTKAASATNAIAGTNTTATTNLTAGTNSSTGTNVVTGTNAVQGTNTLAKSTNAPGASDLAQTNGSAAPKRAPAHQAGMNPDMMAQMMGGGMPGGPMGRGMKKIELPQEVQARIDKIVDSEMLGPIFHPMPMALIGIADQLAYIRSTTGQTGPVKIGGEMGGIKLLRIGVNRVLVEHDGETNELTLFDGIGGVSLMPKPTSSPSTNAATTNAPATNPPAKSAATGNAPTLHTSIDRMLSSNDKETPR
jgi:hypothetical protein